MSTLRIQRITIKKVKKNGSLLDVKQAKIRVIFVT